MSFTVQNPYRGDPSWQWYRGDLHLHSTHSDGLYTPSQLRDFYYAHGYDFIAISDHDRYGDQVSTTSNRDDQTYVLDPSLSCDWFLTIPSYEHSVRDGFVELAHINCINAVPGPAGIHRPTSDYQGAIDRVTATGGFAFFNHPHVYPASPDILRQCRSLTGLEIMNTGSVQYRTSMADAIQWGDATNLWDELLTRGDRLWGYANSDFHFFRQEQPCRASNYVLAPDLQLNSIVTQLITGASYASTGVILDSIQVDGASIQVRAQNGERFRFIGRGGKILQEGRGSDARYDVTGWEGYVRVEFQNDQPVLTAGRLLPEYTQQAWTQPFYIEQATE